MPVGDQQRWLGNVHTARDDGWMAFLVDIGASHSKTSKWIVVVPHHFMEHSTVVVDHRLEGVVVKS